MSLSRPLPEVSRAAVARRLGDPVRPLETAARGGTLVRIRRGHYVDVAEWRAERPDRRHLLLVAAAQAAAKHALVFSHESAAALLGIPIVGTWPDRPQVSTPPHSPRRSTRCVTWHTSDDWGQSDVTDGLRHTDTARTLLEVTATRSFVSGVVAVDHVLRRVESYGVCKQDLVDAIAERRPFRGARRSEAVILFATGLADSPGESLSMVRFFEGGYPMPVQQKRFIGLDGREYSSDFYFEDADAVGESDGWVKYEDPAFLAGRTPQQAFRDEKRREDEIRAQVSALVRWDWDDAWRGAPLFAKLERAGIRPLIPARGRREA